MHKLRPTILVIIFSVFSVGAGAIATMTTPAAGATPPTVPTAYSYGYNGQGELGNGTTTQEDSPAAISFGANEIPSQIAMGTSSAAGIALDTGVSPATWGLYTWGDNTDGELGTGNTTQKDSPTSVTISGVTPSAVAVGGFATYVLGSNGDVYAAGYNGYGELGIGNTTNKDTFQTITSISGITQICAGSYFALALASNGTLYSWGYNVDGELGNGTNTQEDSPVHVSSLPGSATVSKIACGAFHALAIDTTGKVYSWGYNNYGQLGIGNTTNEDTPQGPVSLPTGVVAAQVAGEGYSSMVLSGDGDAYSWGDNFTGELGNNTTTQEDSPVAVSMPTGVTFTQITGGEYNGYGLGSDDNLYGWGANNYGELGNGTTADSYVPTAATEPSGMGWSATPEDGGTPGDLIGAIAVPTAPTETMLTNETNNGTNIGNSSDENCYEYPPNQTTQNPVGGTYSPDTTTDSYGGGVWINWNSSGGNWDYGGQDQSPCYDQSISGTIQEDPMTALRFLDALALYDTVTNSSTFSGELSTMETHTLSAGIFTFSSTAAPYQGWSYNTMQQIANLTGNSTAQTDANDYLLAYCDAGMSGCTSSSGSFYYSENNKPASQAEEASALVVGGMATNCTTEFPGTSYCGPSGWFVSEGESELTSLWSSDYTPNDLFVDWNPTSCTNPGTTSQTYTTSDEGDVAIAYARAATASAVATYAADAADLLHELNLSVYDSTNGGYRENVGVTETNCSSFGSLGTPAAKFTGGRMLNMLTLGQVLGKPSLVTTMEAAFESHIYLTSSGNSSHPSVASGYEGVVYEQTDPTSGLSWDLYCVRTTSPTSEAATLSSSGSPSCAGSGYTPENWVTSEAIGIANISLLSGN